LLTKVITLQLAQNIEQWHHVAAKVLNYFVGSAEFNFQR